MENEQSVKKRDEPKNEVCVSCLKWREFGEDCRVHWEGKMFCTMRVRTPEEWDAEAQVLKR